MRRLLLDLASVALLTGSAFAADLPPAPVYRSQPVVVPPPASNWTGCNLNVGYGYGLWTQDQFLETAALAPLTSNATSGGRGSLGRGGVGCDYEFGVNGIGNVVIGLFGDYDVMNVSGDFQANALGVTGKEKQTGAWYGGGRAGILVTPSLLSYVDVGYTQTRFGGFNLNGAFTGVPTDVVQSHTYNGWFLGGGLEYALKFSWLPINGLFWRNEYRFSTYSAANLQLTSAATGAPTAFALNVRPYDETITSSLV